MSIQIIGAGFPRTGTTTLKRSLELLGYDKTYHMKELMANPVKLPYWKEMEQKRTTDWDALYNGYKATVDYPGYPYYKEHMQQYPDAKVILTVRPFEDWYRSVASTIRKAGPQNLPEKLSMMWKMITNPKVKEMVQCIKMVKAFLWDVQFQGRFEDKEFVEKIFHDHIAEVKATVPREKLLVYEVKDGWGPLCAFLGVPEPAEPLPHLNKRENFKTMIAAMIKSHMK